MTYLGVFQALSVAFLSYDDGRKIPLNSHRSQITRLFGDVQASRRYVSDGMQAFRQGQVQDSIDLFNAAEKAEPRMEPYLWQRGLSYYYADDFDKASRQFRTDVSVNPLDVEEIVWDIASQLRLSPKTFPPTNALALPKGKQDRRSIMNVVYQLFRNEATEEALAKAGHSGRPMEEFYSLLYLGLYAEGRQEPTKAEHYMRQAVQTEYAKSIGQGDYMTAVAKVSCCIY